MGRSFLTVLLIVMFGIAIGMSYFWSTKVDASSEESLRVILAIKTATSADCTRVKKRNPSVVCIPGVTPFTDSDASGFGKSTCDFPGDAKAYLLTKNNKPAGDVRGLSENFACCLAKFFKAGEGAGYNIKINSGYRSVARQATLFKKATAKYGSQSAARKWVAPPGKSNHGRGTAVDLSSSGRKWQHKNASRFGLRFRMSHEPWHIEPSGGSCRGGEKGDRSDDSSYAQSSPSSSLGDLASQLSGSGSSPSPPGGSPGSDSGGNSNPFSQAYEPDLYGGDAGEPQDAENEFLLDDSPLAFDELLGEFGEGNDVKDLVGFDDSQQGDGKVERFENATNQEGDVVSKPPYINAGVSARCSGGALTKDIYGNITCSSGGKVLQKTSELGNIGGTVVDEVGIFFEKFSESGLVAKTLTTLVGSLVPIRHLGDDTTDTNDRYTFDRSGAYDVYIPNDGTAYGLNTREPLNKEDIVAWMTQKDIVAKNNPVQQVFATVSLKFAKPAAKHVSSSLFGLGGSYATAAFLNIANNI